MQRLRIMMETSPDKKFDLFQKFINISGYRRCMQRLRNNVEQFPIEN